MPLVQLNKTKPVVKEFPFSISHKAICEMIRIKDINPEYNDGYMVRVTVDKKGCAGLKFNLDFDDNETNDDLKESFYSIEGAITAIVDKESAKYLTGITINYIQKGIIGGFRFEGGDKVKKKCGCGLSFGI